jgi:hypothetical protein
VNPDFAEVSVRLRPYRPATGRWIAPDPLGPGASVSNLYKYVSNSPTYAVDPSGLQAVAPGMFDKGTISFTRFEKLFETQDVVGYTNQQRTGPELFLRTVLQQANQPSDFSKLVTLDKVTVLALQIQKINVFFRAVRNGLDVRIRADFKPGVNPKDYFWSQFVGIRSASTDKEFSAAYLAPKPFQWDKGWKYPVSKAQTGNNFLEMTDQPSYNFLMRQNAVGLGGKLLFFKAKDLAKYDDFKAAFNRLNGAYQMDLITQLRRVHPNIGNKEYVNVGIAGAQMLGHSAPGGIRIAGELGLEAALDKVSEAVGQYVWGFKMSSNPFAVSLIGPTWQQFK